jgi:hypothetical protein
MGKRLWAVLNDSDELLAYEEAHTKEEAIQAFARKADLSEEDVRHLYVAPGEKIRGDMWVPKWLVEALENPEEVLGPPESSPKAWDAFWEALAKLEARGIRLASIEGWVKVKGRDFWVPVVK